VDFVVVGIFIGAIIVGAGAVVRDFGPRRRPFLTRRVRRTLEPELVAKAWRRYCQAVGSLILTMGMIVILATVVSMVISLSDNTGLMVVGVTAILAIVVSAIGTFVISGHYQRGGFDPVFKAIKPRPVKAPPAVVEHDVEIPLSALPGDSVDDLFSADLAMPGDALAATEPEVATFEPALSGDGVTNGLLPASSGDEPIIAADPTVKHPPVEQVVPGPERAQPSESPMQSGEPGARPSRLVPRRFQVNRNGQADQPATDSVEQPVPEHMPVERTAAPRRQPESPLIDPDEELPAWNAPSRAIPVPEPYIPPAPRVASRSESRELPRPETGSGFESSLFADLDVPAGDEAEVAGPFQSRLLNELTSSDDEPVEGAADVLLDEFSLPSRNQPGARDADNGR
jgi:hypothetical protein